MTIEPFNHSHSNSFFGDFFMLLHEISVSFIITIMLILMIPVLCIYWVWLKITDDSEDEDNEGCEDGEDLYGL